MKFVAYIYILFFVNICFSQKAQELKIDSQTAPLVYNIITDNENVKWCATNQGAFYFDGEQFKKFESEEFEDENFVLINCYKNKIFLFNYTNTFYILTKNANKTICTQKVTVSKELSVNTFFTYLGIENDTLFMQQLFSQKLLCVSLNKLTENKVNEFCDVNDMVSFKKENRFFFHHNLLRIEAKINTNVSNTPNISTPNHSNNTFVRDVKLFVANDSVYFYDIFNNKLLFGTKSYMNNVTIANNIYIDQIGCWVSTNVGLFLYCKSKCYVFFSNTNVASVTTDFKNNLFISFFEKGIKKIGRIDTLVNRFIYKNVNNVIKIEDSITLNNSNIYRFSNINTKTYVLKFNNLFDFDNGKLKITFNKNCFSKVLNSISTYRDFIVAKKQSNTIESNHAFKFVEKLNDSTLLTCNSSEPYLIVINKNGFYKKYLGKKLNGIVSDFTLIKNRLLLSVQNEIYEYNLFDSSIVLKVAIDDAVKSFICTGDSIIIATNSGKMYCYYKNNIVYSEHLYLNINERINYLLKVKNKLFIVGNRSILVQNLSNKKRYCSNVNTFDGSTNDFLINEKQFYKRKSFKNAQTIFNNILVKREINSKLFIKKVSINDSIFNLLSDKICLPPNKQAYFFKIYPFVIQEDYVPYKISYTLLKDEEVLLSQDLFKEEYINLGLEGSGVFILKINIVDFNNNITTKAFEIFVETPFYKTIWFIIVCVLFLLILVYFITYKYFKLEQQRSEQIFSYEKNLLLFKNKSLYSLMNPHFIFNTLNSISTAVNLNKPNANSIIGLFSNLIRRNLEDSLNDFIRLNDELEKLEVYVNIENFRFSNSIKLIIEVDYPTTKNILIPSFILQPVVENAIIHGLLPKNGGVIKIDIKIELDNLCIIVNDDGVGFEGFLNLKNPYHKSLGLKSIIERLDTLSRLYKQQFSLSIDKNYEFNKVVGTRVVIKLPIKINE